MNVVKKTRDITNLSQTELSELIGITRRQIINLEGGKNNITKPMGILMLCIQCLGKDKIEKMEKKLSNFDMDRK